MNLHFYKCEICGKTLAILSGDGIPTSCCGEDMTELIPNHTDGAAEKHVPVFHTEVNTVHVWIGQTPHPMTEQHSILWVGLKSANGFQFKELQPGDSPEARFAILPGDRVEAVYAYCSLHGLWISEREGI